MYRLCEAAAAAVVQRMPHLLVSANIFIFSIFQFSSSVLCFFLCDFVVVIAVSALACCGRQNYRLLLSVEKTMLRPTKKPPAA